MQQRKKDVVLSIIHCKSLRCLPPKSSGVIFMDRGGHECTFQNLKWESHSLCISFYFYYTHHGIPGVKGTDLWRCSTGHPPAHKAFHVNRLIKGITTNVSVSWYVGENFLLENRTLNTSGKIGHLLAHMTWKFRDALDANPKGKEVFWLLWQKSPRDFDGPAKENCRIARHILLFTTKITWWLIFYFVFCFSLPLLFCGLGVYP